MFGKLLTQKFNPNHNPKNGQFTSSEGGSSSGGGVGRNSGGAGDFNPATRKDRMPDESDAAYNARRIAQSVMADNPGMTWEQAVAQESKNFMGAVQSMFDGKPAAPAKPAGPRPLHEIAREISRTWRKQGKGINYAAKPYLEALHGLESVNENYGMDSGRSVVAYFLSNASSFKGPDAKRLKDELKMHLKQKGENSGFGKLISQAARP